MAKEFRLEDPGEGIHEAEIVEVHVSGGDELEEGDIAFVVETDKAAVEMPVPFTGTVESVEVGEDETVEVGDVLLTYTPSAGGREAEGEEAEGDEAREDEARAEAEGAAAGGGVAGAPPEEDRGAEAAEEEAAEEEPAPHEDEAEHEAESVLASPLARKKAKDAGVELASVEGTGPQGRVTVDDVEAAAGEAPEAPAEAAGLRGPTLVDEVPALPDFTQWGEVERQALRSVRKTIARRMFVSWHEIPHVTHEDVADITDLESLRKEYTTEVEEAGGALTLTTFVMKAAVAALKEHPRFNASLDVESREIILKKYYHLGVAVHTDRGLMVPVVRDVDRKSLMELAVELTALAERTRDGDLEPKDVTGGTFTLTNPGTIGGTGFTPIINWPQVGILGTGRARWQPTVVEDDNGRAIEPRLQLPLALGFDHRVVDGADAARFTNSIIDLLEDPRQLLLEV